MGLVAIQLFGTSMVLRIDHSLMNRRGNMWKPPVELSPGEQQIVKRTKKHRRFFVFLRENRHELFDEEFQEALAVVRGLETREDNRIEPALLATATVLQAYCGVGDQEAVERSIMDRRWQLVLDCLDVEKPPFGKATLWRFRVQLIEHELDKVLLDRTVQLAEKKGGFRPRKLRAALDSSPLFGAARVEDTFNLLGHALFKAVGTAAKELGRSVDELLDEAGMRLLGQSSLKAALDLNWGEPGARHKALSMVLEELERWKRWLEGHSSLSEKQPPMKEAMETLEQILEQDTEPDPDGGSGGRRLKKGVSHDRRISVEDQQMRHGRKSSSRTFNGFKQHLVHDLDSKVIREVVVKPANEPEHEVVELVKDELDKGKGLAQLNVDLGYMGSPQIQRWAEQGVHIIARPWPQRNGKHFGKEKFKFDFAKMTITCPSGQSMPISPGHLVTFPAASCDSCALRAACTDRKPGRGRSVGIRADEEFQDKLRAKMRTKARRASLRKRTSVEHAISHHVATQGRRARYKGLRKNQFDGRRHAAVQNLHIAARYDASHELHVA